MADGNTPTVAVKHYPMTTDQHLNTAIEGEEKVVQIPVQQPSEMARKEQKFDNPLTTQAPVFPGLAKNCGFFAKA